MDTFRVLVDTLQAIDPLTFDWRGEPLPFVDGPTTVAFQTEYPGATFGWSLDGVFRGVLRADSQGTVTVETVLQHGPHAIKLEHDGTGRTYQRNVHILYLATIYAAWAEIFDSIEAEVSAYRNSKVVDLARVDYLESVHGVRLGLSNDLGLSEEAYRNAIKVLASNYRTQHGVRQAIEQLFAVLTGADGFVVPTEWRRFWSFSDNLAENPDQVARALLVESTPDDPNVYIRRQYVVESWAASAATTYTGTINQPPEPSAINVYFPTGWDPQNSVTVTGLDLEGRARTQVFDSPLLLPGLGVVSGALRVFARITSISKVNQSGSNNVSLGLVSGDFVRVSAWSNTGLSPGGTLTWSVPPLGTTTGATASWRGGAPVSIDAALARAVAGESNVYVDVPTDGSVPHIVGQRVVAAGGSITMAATGPDANVRGRIALDGVESEIRYNGTLGSRLVSALLSAFPTDNPAAAIPPRLTDYDGTPAFALGYEGLLDNELALTATACDYSFGPSSVVQLPVDTALTTAPLNPGATSVTTGAGTLSVFSPVTNTALGWDGDSSVLPSDWTAPRGIAVRVGRGLRFLQSLTVSVAPIAGTSDAIVTFTPFAPAPDAIPGDSAPGAYLHLSGFLGSALSNNGLHQVISLTGTSGGLYTAVLRHVDARSAGAFTSATSVGSITVTLHSMGEVARLTGVNLTTNTATLAVGDGGLLGTYPSGARIERLSQLTVVRRRIDGIRGDALRLLIDGRYRPRNTILASVSATLTVTGRGTADGWRVFDNSDVNAGSNIAVTATRVVDWRAGGPSGGAARTVIAPPAGGGVLPGVGGFVPESRLAPWRDQVLRLDAQVTAHDGTSGTSAAAIEVSFDGGDTWVLGSNTTGTLVPNRFYDASAQRGSFAHTSLSTSVEVPALAANPSRATIEGRGLWWRVRFSTTAWPGTTSPPATARYSVAHVQITPVFGAVDTGFIARELIPVAAARRTYGTLVYAWPGEDITSTEAPAPRTGGGNRSLSEVERARLRTQITNQLRSLTHVGGVREVYYVGEYNLDGGSGNQIIMNRFGAHDPASFGAATLEGMESVEETPLGWLSFARPTVNPVVTTTALFSGSPLRATLAVAADKSGAFPQNPNDDDLLVIQPVNGYPFRAEAIPSSAWLWISATQIEVNSTVYNALAATYGAGATFAVTYRRPVRLTTAVMNLDNTHGGAGAYSWLVDASLWVRPNPTRRVVRVREPLTFDSNGRAVLRWTPDATALSTAQLIVTTPTQKNVLGSAVFVIESDVAVLGRPSTVLRLTGATFDAGNFYEVEYDSLALTPASPAAWRIEARTAATALGVASAPWYTVGRHELLDMGRTGPTTVARGYAQVRLTFTRIDEESSGDIRLFSLGLKGLRLRGAGDRYAPGVLVP